ncbi:MAG: thymidine phosphorylase, partial [Firmicutes bacterium]|nr:thymidine phosphorylase [Bacillota bacterium]
AWKKFVSWVTAQGADARVLDGDLPLAPIRITWELGAQETVASINTKGIGLAALSLGAGRHVKDQPVDHQVGIRCMVKVGQTYPAGTVVAEIYARDAQAADEALRLVKEAVTLGPASNIADEPILAIIE